MTGEPRNILLICVDQWRGDTLPVLGHPVVRTPAIDALCADGVTFARHYTQGTPCAPGRASMLTGMYTMNHRVVQNRTPLDRGFTNIALELRRAGYEPGLIGYTTTALDPRDLPDGDPAREQMNAVLPGFRPVRVNRPERQRDYYGYLARMGYDLPTPPEDVWRPDPAHPRARDPHSTAAPWLVKAQHSDTAWYAEGALEFIAGHRHSPWMLHLGFYRPHPPFLAPAPYHDMYDPAACPPPVRAETPAAEARVHPMLDHFLRSQKTSDFFRHGEGLVADLTVDAIRQIRATYYGLMTEIDDQLAKVFDLLKRTGQWDRTLVILTSDHGEELGDHHLLNKLGWFEGSYHIPMIVRDPSPAADGTRGRIEHPFTGTIDLMPTILDWIGAEIPRQVDGRSLLPFCHGAAPTDWRREIFYEHDVRDLVTEAPQTALDLHMDECGLAVLRDDRWCYVHFPTLPPLLYDMVADPGQLNDLAGDPAYAGVMDDCRRRMLNWRLVHQYRALTGIACGKDGFITRR